MSNSTRQIDHSQGHAFIQNGGLFYSLNSSRRIVVPDRPGSSTRYRFHKKDALWDRFHEPQWWVEAYCFLSFVPLRPSFEGDTFGSLRSIIPFILGPGSDGRFYVSDDKVALWTQLQDWLFYILSLLDQSPSTYPALKPIPPSLLGFKERHKSLRAARIRATISRDWFVIWMGLLSFKVAALPNWFNLLAEKGVPQIWLHDFSLSTACSFSEGCPRVGIILDWLDHNNKNQPPPEWFTSHHVPVWYPWTPAHAQASSNPRFAHLRPPVEILQVATTFSPIPPPSQSRQQQPAPINPAPPTTANTSAHMTPKEFDAARKAYVRTKPWAPFFEARAKQNEIQLKNETPQQRQTRLNRERKPPTISAEVYEWDWSDEDPLVLVRTRVLSRCREDTLDLYKESQCRYDAFRNAWDVCEWFDLDDGDNSAPMDTDGEDDDEFTGGSVGGYDSGGDIDEDCNPEEEQAAHSRYIANRTHEISTSRNAISWPSTQSHADIEVDLSEDRNPFELLTHLEVFYGYVSPLETNSSPWIRKDWDDSMKAIGWFVDDNPPLKDFEAIVIKFIQDFTSSNPPPQNSDFNPQNYRAIRLSKLKDMFRLIQLPADQFFYGKNRVVYVLKADSFMDGEACPYSIALTNARDAIFIYRLLSIQDYLGITLCQFLLENGIPFRTLQRLDRVPVHRMLNNDETLIPIRLSGYQFRLCDYEGYVRHRAQLLTSPRGRAALLHGGIVARIAREHIETDSALFGPSSAVTVHRLGIHIVENNGSELWDDHLTENEIGIICGLHRCYTGHGAQMSQESWWPMPSLWENEKACGLNWGHWTQWDEQWYLTQLKDIAKGSKEGVPFPTHIW